MSGKTATWPTWCTSPAPRAASRWRSNISTAGLAGQGYAWEMNETAQALLAGEIVDPTMHAVIFAAPADADFRAEATWRRANPNYGVSVKPEFMQAEALRAARSPRAENDFRRFHLNQWTEQVTRWLPMGDPGWKGCAADPRDATAWQTLAGKLKGRRCLAGLDLALTSDISSRCLMFPAGDDLPRPVFLWRFWLPQQTVDDAIQARRIRYESFVRAGALDLTPGNITDYAFIEQAMVQDAENYDIAWIGVDPYNASDLLLRLKDVHGLPVETVRQGTLTMSPPSKGFERLVMGNAMEHGNNPVATWMARNAVVRTDHVGNIIPDKAKAMDKIDGIVAAIIAYAGSIAGQGAPAKTSIYEERGLIAVG